MTVIELANQDLKGIGKVGEKHIEMLSRQVAQATTREELVQALVAATGNAKTQFAVATILMVMADDKGRYRGGNPNLADSILDQQASKIKRYGEGAYRLTEKQMMVVVNSVWDWLK